MEQARFVAIAGWPSQRQSAADCSTALARYQSAPDYFIASGQAAETPVAAAPAVSLAKV
jgi:hypothetical protein